MLHQYIMNTNLYSALITAALTKPQERFNPILIRRYATRVTLLLTYNCAACMV